MIVVSCKLIVACFGWFLFFVFLLLANARMLGAVGFSYFGPRRQKESVLQEG